MFNSGILDVVIGLVVVYLQLSLVCTAVNELIASVLKKRAKELERGIGTLLTNPELVKKFYAHPLIKGLRPDGDKPSYIPSRIFALAIMDIVRRHSFDGSVTMATQAFADKAAHEVNAQAAVDAAGIALSAAEAVHKTAEALFDAGVGDKLAASRAVQDAANQEAAARGAQVKALTKLAAATKAKDDAEAYLTQIRTDANSAKAAETDAQAAETKAKENPENQELQDSANVARKNAIDAADKVSPSAASLLTEARDKVATVQNDVVPGELKTALLALMDNAGTNLNKAQTNLEQWFDDAMDSVSGVYKKQSQIVVIGIAILVTVFANVDSLQVADSLSRDKALRESLVAAAPELAKADSDAVERERNKTQPSPSPIVSPSPTPSPGTSPANEANPNSPVVASPSPSPAPTPSPTQSLSNVDASLDKIKKLGMPLGYIRVCTPSEAKRLENSCPNEVDAAVIDAESGITRAQEDFDKATAKLQKADAAKTAVETAQKTFETAKVVQEQAAKSGKPAEQQLAEVSLTKAKDDLDKANVVLKRTSGDKIALEATQKLASAHLEAAREARDRALRAAVAAKEVEAKAVSAEAKALSFRADAQAANPPSPEKEKAAVDAEAAAQLARREADNRKETLRIECPQCRKEAELSVNELKQRLPTTHEYHILSKDFFPAVFAFASDCWDLLYSHWLGWLLTIFAISLGAPFWFDLLNRLMVIRSTVKPHEKSKEQDSKDNSDEADENNKS